MVTCNVEKIFMTCLAMMVALILQSIKMDSPDRCNTTLVRL